MVRKFRSGFSFVLSFLLQLEPPSNERIHEFKSLPEPLKWQWSAIATTVLGICWDGSPLFRLAVYLGGAIVQIAKLQRRLWPEQSSHYQQWKHISRASAGC